MSRSLSVAGVTFGGKALPLIAGPCVIESERHCLGVAEKLAKIAERAGFPLIFKSSYDKANRTSLDSYRGPGLEAGLAVLAKVKKRFGLPLLTDVHKVEEVDPAAGVCDILQVPAFLCRQTDLVVAVAKSGRVVNVKKGQFLAPWDMKNVLEKIRRSGGRAMITERGVSFGYNTLVNDFRSIPEMQKLGVPVVFDATHSAQQPGGKGSSTGGQREMVPVLARCGVAAGADGVFLECHENPDRAPSDGPNMLRLKELPALLEQLAAIRAAIVR
ncbi:MAG: 2-dehydro-3-deoxyphosphooctonate aldolase [Planctomycetota bacterium]|nr:MAG: 2-dehydro-3-deoxyphosphooctonate aldolase [Planctomycetota bacterium]